LPRKFPQRRVENDKEDRGMVVDVEGKNIYVEGKADL